MNGNLFATVESRIADPLQLFLTAETGTVCSYGGMLAASGRYANVIASLGVKVGDRVAVQTGKHVDCVWLYLACLRVGAIYLPLNPAYTPAEVAYFVSDAEPVLMVCEPTRVASLRAGLGLSAPHIETLDASGSGSLQKRAPTMPADFVTVGTDADDLALEVGSRIVRINEQPVRDSLDLRFLEADAQIELEIAPAGGGASVIYEIEKEAAESLGVVPGADAVRQCANKCVFCFVDGNPAGARPVLSLNDDD